MGAVRINKLRTIQSIVFYGLSTIIICAVSSAVILTDIQTKAVSTTVHSPVLGIDNRKGMSMKDTISERAEYSLVTLEDKYSRLGGKYYASNMRPYLNVIDSVLREEGLDQNALFVKAMFYIGQQESHWRKDAVSGTPIAHCKRNGSFLSLYGAVSRCANGDVQVHKEYATGIFQFLPSTFKKVSNGNIFDPEDQIRAFIVMVETGRIDEFATLFICNYPPCLDSQIKVYILLYPNLHNTRFHGLLTV